MTEAQLRQWAEVYARDDATPTATGRDSAHVIFRVGGERFAVPLEDLDEVARVEVGIGLEHASALVLGLVNIRGEVVPMLDTAAVLGARGSWRLDTSNRTLVVRDARGRRTALPVDRIESIELLAPELFRSPHGSPQGTPSAADDAGPVCRIGIGEHAGRSLTLLDLGGLRRAGADGEDTF
jgi:purine-binding chemotaxis protein CheW